MKRKCRYSDFLRVEKERLRAGKFGGLAKHLDSAAQPSDRVFLLARVSPTKDRGHDLEKLVQQMESLERIATERRLKVVGKACRRGKGTDLHWIATARALA